MAFQAIQSLISEAIDRFGDRVAVESPQRQLTYAELHDDADGIASALQAAGVRAGSVIPVLTDDQAELAASIVGILRIGGVFAPMDVGAHRSRLRSMLAAAGSEHALVGADSLAVADDVLPASVRQIHLSTVKGASADGYLPHVPEPNDPSHLFFTSGSTGYPKGILGRLSGIGHFIRWEADLLSAGPGWRVSQLISPAFDAVLRDVFLPLSVGGTMCVPPVETRLNPIALAQWLDRERIDLVHCVPSVFRPLIGVDVTNDTAFASLKYIALSGEKLAPGDAARWFERFGDRIRLLNLYGPTETTMTKTYHFVTRADTERTSIPIGRPLPETEVLLLDEQGKEVPSGKVGEIHLNTPHRALGYHGLPEQTAKAFIADPLHPSTDRILYRTGDFARLLPNGELEFLGRRDNQVKIGGVRVELEHVEETLQAHPAVDAAAVVLAGTGDDTPFLCAFVESVTEPDLESLRTHLREHLPDAAVPAMILPRREIPRTVSGKIDRKALRVPAKTDGVPGADDVGPRNATERTIADVFSAVLPAPVTDIRRKFLQLGGTSMTVIEMLSRLDSEFGISLSLLDFLRNPTVEGIAILIDGALLSDTADDDLLGS